MSVVRVAVIGSRNFSDYNLFCEKLEYLIQNIKEDIVYISGACKSGADKMIADYCRENNKELIEYPPDYIKYPGKHALFKRNDEIVANCDYLISFWNGISRGASYTHNKALKDGKRVKIIMI
jgi:predicted Rossmann fold nucleotide-binding protein DprA/Smf involved in DNA uptake